MELIMHGWEPTPVDDYAEASGLYCHRRDESGEGASTFGDGHIAMANGTHVARISYNGRIWRTGKWKPDDRPLWDNRNPDKYDSSFPRPASAEPVPTRMTATQKELSMEESDRLETLHHEVARVRKSIIKMGFHLTHHDAAHIVARAYGQDGVGKHRARVLKGIEGHWSHHAAAAAMVERLGITPEDARRAADVAARAVMRDAVTISEISDMLGAAPALADTPLPMHRMRGRRRHSLTEAGVRTIGDLVDKAGDLAATEMDAALYALTEERTATRG